MIRMLSILFARQMMDKRNYAMIHTAVHQFRLQHGKVCRLLDPIARSQVGL